MPPKSRSKKSLALRLALIAAAIGVALFAVQGGEFGTLDLVSQAKRMAKLEITVDSLQHAVDSLKRYRKRLDSDPALQEKIAREEFGMVRGKNELLYRFADPRAR